MPVKVRCKECERVVTAPDRARGKAVKCPQCGKPVRVPAEKAAPAAPAGKKAGARPPSSSMVIAKLDLDSIEDTQTRICPKCGAEVSAEDTECPECQVNLVTGMLSPELQAERSRKGPNPRKYYKEFFSDSFEFWKKNKGLSISLALNTVIFTALGALCVMVALWCAAPLARIFWWFLATVTILIPPGLAWNLHTKIIDLTLRKKKKLSRHHFEKLLGTALGFKFVLWFLDVAAPLHILALVFLILGFRLVAVGLEVPAVIFAALLFPLAMSHMAMPVTIRGWLLNKMSGPFFRTLPALAYWAMFLGLLMIVPIGCVAAAGIVWGKGLGELVQNSSYNSVVHVKLAEIADLPKNSVPPPELADFRGKKEIDLDWTPLFMSSGLCVVAAGVFGAGAVFLMRANGLYTRYFLDYLDLETMEPEVKYVPKTANIDEIETKKGLTWQVVLAAVGLAGVFGFAFGGAGAAIMGKSFLLGVGSGLLIVGILCGLIGHFWLLYEAFIDSLAWFGAILLASNFGWVASIFLGPLGFAITPLISIVYGIINWSNAKYPLVIGLVGNFFYTPLGMIILLIAIGPEFLGFGGGEAAAGGH
ncbi:MAG TPA: zinc ribbon domain-containing protein [Planctomycetaceae bacterium]|nr:zinc ribbon domain-containing protein [Planctomycetaceae bacterium]